MYILFEITGTNSSRSAIYLFSGKGSKQYKNMHHHHDKVWIRSQVLTKLSVTQEYIILCSLCQNHHVLFVLSFSGEFYGWMEYQGGNIPREETEKETLNVPVKESFLLFNGLFLPLLFGLTLFDIGRNVSDCYNVFVLIFTRIPLYDGGRVFLC